MKGEEMKGEEIKGEEIKGKSNPNCSLFTVHYSLKKLFTIHRYSFHVKQKDLCNQYN